MSDRKSISNVVIRRLPKYYRYISALEDRGLERISSQELGEITGFTASQIRQDFNHFGSFGQQGYGYNIKELKENLAQILGLKEERKLVIVGLGRMGEAIAKSEIFSSSGIKVVGLFDNNPDKFGFKIENLIIQDSRKLASFLDEEKVDIVTITTPKTAAQEIADLVIAHGVSAIWNFAMVDLKAPDHVYIENMHLEESLHTIAYYIQAKEQ